ncbi:hypothetical protein [Enhygromyxa salina]|uniref:Uncharacterized protein n=1 Tax=Enhygromyxa salina TaxID=215803 RepID=A0A2S9XTI4_9BACT|nr:hypothetical protein [Enhygromyxa salina]PRP96031.1 hypothetical protein ENSA7_68450 [Enhygromyxa salina]
MPNQTETFTSSREGCSPARGRLGGRERGTATTILLAALLVFTPGCATEPVDDPVDQAREPIGNELISYSGTWAYYTCAASHFYREGRQVQQLCFFHDGRFSFENRGTLTPEASVALDVELVTADFDDRTPVNYLGFCGAPDAGGIVTMWAGERSIEFAPFCLFEGIVPLYEAITAIQEELWDCGQAKPDKLESIQPGCRLL